MIADLPAWIKDVQRFIGRSIRIKGA